MVAIGEVAVEAADHQEASRREPRWRGCSSGIAGKARADCGGVSACGGSYRVGARCYVPVQPRSDHKEQHHVDDHRRRRRHAYFACQETWSHRRRPQGRQWLGELAAHQGRPEADPSRRRSDSGGSGDPCGGAGRECGCRGFSGIPVDDRTGKFGGLSSGPLPKAAVNSIILHRTGGSAAAALRSYQNRIETGSTIGAHYLVDEKGAVILTVPIDRRVSHVGRTRDGFENSSNSHAVGIEHAGAPLSLDVPANAKDTATLEKNRASIAHMDIAPLFRRRLLDLSDRELLQVARDNREKPGDVKWSLYGDLDAPQRRACCVLVSALMTHFGLAERICSPIETVSFKSIGEGENIKEFLTARFAYPGLVARLAALAEGNAALRANVALQSLVGEEKPLAAALAVDATAGEVGPQNPIAPFYDKFWKRRAQLADLVAFLSGAGDSAELAEQIAAWIR